MIKSSLKKLWRVCYFFGRHCEVCHWPAHLFRLGLKIQAKCISPFLGGWFESQQLVTDEIVGKGR
jgi:hypothetical protein